MENIIASYTIDRYDTITAMSGDIAPYTKMHGDNLLGFGPNAQVGSIWRKVVHNSSLRMYLRLLLTAVRASGQPWHTRYSGDSYGQHHSLELRISPLSPGDVQISHILLSSTPSMISEKLICADESSADFALRRCCICARLNQGLGWEDSSAVLESLPPALGSPHPVIYSVCWDCSDSIGQQISQLFETYPPVSEMLENHAESRIAA